jgi:DNA mismatch endonuclease Vsr
LRFEIVGEVVMLAGRMTTAFRPLVMAVMSLPFACLAASNTPLAEVERLELAGRFRDAALILSNALHRPGVTARRGARLEFELDRLERVAVFVDGCFWHGCPKHSPPEVWIRKSTMPISGRSRSARTGVAFWSAKLRQNRERDRYVTRRLRATGWKVIRIWEHDLTKPGRTPGDAGSLRVIKRILRSLKRQMEPARTRCWNLTCGKQAVKTPRS